jgi:hypothetical protein
MPFELSLRLVSEDFLLIFHVLDATLVIKQFFLRCHGHLGLLVIGILIHQVLLRLLSCMLAHL